MSAASTPSEAMSASVSSVGNALKQPTAMLVISGGEGYVDFRIGECFLKMEMPDHQKCAKLNLPHKKKHTVLIFRNDIMG